MPGSKIAPVPIMRMYGVTELGNSVCCHVHGFCPYLYVAAPQSFAEHHCKQFRVRNHKNHLHDLIENYMVRGLISMYYSLGCLR